MNEALLLQITLIVFGTLKAIIRLIEPFVYHTYLSMIKDSFKCLCRKKKPLLNGENRKTISSLNSTNKDS